jgi:hypothetical protein
MSRRLTPEQARDLVAGINRTVETLDRQHAEMRQWLLEMAARLDERGVALDPEVHSTDDRTIAQKVADAHSGIVITSSSGPTPYRWPPR